MPARRSRRATVLTAALALTAVVAPVSAGATSHSTKPSSVAAPAPKNAAKDPKLRLTDIACPAAGDCFAVGTYHDKGGAVRGVLEHLVDGKWQASRAPEPVFAATNPKVELSIITCATANFCAAFGSYIDATDAPKRQNLLEMYAPPHHGATPKWIGSRMPAPGGALAAIEGASCSPARTCAAVGNYSQHGVRHALLVTYGPTGWVAADAALPSPNVVGDPNANSSLNAIDCPSGAACFAVGNFHTVDGQHGGLLERHDSSGVWTPGRAQDGGAGRDPGTQLTAVSCASMSNCVIGGQHSDRPKHQVGLFLTWADSTYSGSISAPVPSRGASDPAMSITALSCSSAANCAAISTMTDAHGHQDGAVLRLSDNQWHAVATPLDSAAGNPHVVLADLACGGVAVGSFTTADGRTRPLLATLDASTWTGQAGPRPSSAGKKAASLAAVACDPGGPAIAVGRYVDGSGRHRGMITRIPG